jgi:hypothetical protein
LAAVASEQLDLGDQLAALDASHGQILRPFWHLLATHLIALSLSARVPAQQYDTLENDYNQLNQRLSSEIGAQQVHITRLQGAIKVAVNSELLFPSGGWQMPPRRPRRSLKWPDPCAVPADHDHRDRLHG